MKINEAINGQKVGMTQIFKKNGIIIPVTLIYIPKSIIIQKKIIKKYKVLKTIDAERKEKKINQINLKKTNMEIGNIIDITSFRKEEYIDITGKSIGKGFSGVVKKYKFRGLEASHGVSKSHRSQGSTGQCQDPGKIFKGKKMAGQMGNKKTTIQNIKIIDIEKELNILIVKGSLPGYKNSYLRIRHAKKKTFR